VESFGAASALDVWIVNARGLGAACERKGKDLWMYECRFRGTNAPLHRYWTGLYAYAMHRRFDVRACWTWGYLHDDDSRFREGREGWLTADEMKAAGIAQEIIGQDDDAMDLTGSDLADFEAHGLKIAALASGLAALKTKGTPDAGNDGTAPAPEGAAGADDAENEPAAVVPDAEPSAERILGREEGREVV
jgi:hypothetical protein